MENKFYVILYIENIQFQKDIEFPLYFKVMRIRKIGFFEKVAFQAETPYSIMDANLIASFNCEFVIPITLIKKKSKKILRLELNMLNSLNRNQEVLGDIQLNVANLNNPKDMSKQFSEIITKKYDKCQIYFRIVVLPFEDFLNNPPSNFFGFVSYKSVVPIIYDLPSQVSTFTNIEEDNSILSEYNNLTPIFKIENSILNNNIEEKNLKKSKNRIKSKKDNKINSSNDLLNKFFQKKTISNSLSTSLNDINEIDINLKNQFNLNENFLFKICIDQCKLCLIENVHNIYIASFKRDIDYSDRLLEPFINFNIAELPNIQTNDYLYICESIFQGLNYSLTKNQSIQNLFGLLSTTLNFGLKLSNESYNSTKSHLIILDKLSPFISKISHTLTQILVSTISYSISSDGFEFADSESMDELYQITRLFLSLSQTFNIPEKIIQSIVVESCKYFDSLLFNIIVDTADLFNEDKINILIKKVKDIQKVFNCLSSLFSIAFPNLLDLITLSKSLLSGIQINRIIKSPLLRSIAERCYPNIILPNNLTFDDLGEKINNNSILKVILPTINFDFKFENLYLNEFL